jgi:hypothetical protein
MSLWNMSLNDATFNDVDEFCKIGHREGLRVDYKQDIPSNLAKTVAAFANTRGGLILLGVEGDKSNNEPKWPCPGMPRSNGVTERIAQICRDNIYPPILPEFTPVLDDPNDPSRVFLVVRVNESSTAPHTIDQGTRVFVRSNDTTDHFELAHIDRIGMLFKRRADMDATRERLIERYLDRSIRNYNPDDPFVWWACLPEFPDGDICTLEECRLGCDLVSGHRAPNGYFGTTRSGRSEPKDQVWSGAGRQGDIFYGRAFKVDQEREIPGPFLAKRTVEFLNHCQHFCHGGSIAYPGLLRFAVGFANVLSRRMTGFHDGSDSLFPDAEYRVDRTTSLDEISQQETRWRFAYGVVAEIFHSFDLSEPPPMTNWQISGG